MNIQLQPNSLLMRTGNIFQNGGLKSTQEKLQRQEKRDNQVAFLENQKNNLKNMTGDSMEEISRKLELFHSYEDQIAAAKEEYNNAQMFHVMEEAKERGEQIAKAAEKFEPKTQEERLEELVEEARGTDENKGMLSETMEELEELTEEMTEEMTENITEEMTEEMTEELSQEKLAEQVSEELADKMEASASGNEVILSDAEKISEFHRRYRALDIRI